MHFRHGKKGDVFGNPMSNQGSKIANYPRSVVRRASPGVEGNNSSKESSGKAAVFRGPFCLALVFVWCYFRFCRIYSDLERFYMYL